MPSKTTTWNRYGRGWATLLVGFTGLTALSGGCSVPPSDAVENGGSDAEAHELFSEDMPEQAPAADVALLSVEANQGVRAVLAEDGFDIPADERAVVFVSDRATLVRARLLPAPRFEARAILVRLTLLYPDGSQLDLDRELELDAEQQTRTVDWELEPGSVRQGMQYRVRLLELQPMERTLEHPPVLPEDAPGEFGIAYAGQQLRVVLVPFRHQVEGCSQAPATDPDTLAAYRKHLEMRYPVQGVDLQLHEEVLYTEEIERLEPLLLRTQHLRMEELPAPDVFYVGLVRPCGNPSTPGGLGLRPSVAGALDQADRRVAVVRDYAKEPAFSYEKLVAHEIGHNIGRTHVHCSGEESNIDPAYPHEDGRIGVTGYGIHDDRLRSPNTPDYMTYCTDGDYWVSDYGWNHAATVLDQLAQATATATLEPERVPVLRIEFDPDGTATMQRSWASQGILRTDATVHARLTAGRTVELSAQIDELDDSNARFLTIPLPVSGLGFEIGDVEAVVDGAREHIVSRHLAL